MEQQIKNEKDRIILQVKCDHASLKFCVTAFNKTCIYFQARYSQQKSAYCFNRTAHPDMYCYLHVPGLLSSYKVSSVLQDSERFLTRSQDLEYQLSSKERELDLLSNKQKRVGVHFDFQDMALHCHIKQMCILVCSHTRCIHV